MDEVLKMQDTTNATFYVFILTFQHHDVCDVTSECASTPGKLKVCLTTVGIEPTFSASVTYENILSQAVWHWNKTG